MQITRRQFVQSGVATFTMGFAAPGFLCDAAQAQGASARNLVVLYLSGGNDGLSTLIPYTDSFYYSRRPTLGIPAADVLQIGSDASGRPLGLHPRLVGLRSIFNQGRLALIQRTGYQNSSRSHFLGTDIWSTANPQNSQGPGWLGRYLDTVPAPVDPLIGWSTTRETPHTLEARTISVPAIQSPATYVFASPNSGAERQYEQTAAIRIASHVPVGRPHVAFVSATMQAAFATLDRIVPVTQYVPSLTYPTSALGQALRTVAGALVKAVGTRIFWVQFGGFDTHSQQAQGNGAYANLMATLDAALLAFHDDLRNQGLLNDTIVLLFSEFGRRVNENASFGTDHGAGGLMMVLGGAVRGKIYGTAASLNPAADNPTLENNGQDVRYETDFRAVYAPILDTWLGGNSVSILGGDYRSAAPRYL